MSEKRTEKRRDPLISARKPKPKELSKDQYFLYCHQYPTYGQPNQGIITAGLPPGKRQLMEKYFTPVYSPSSQDDNKTRKHKNHHHHPHDHQQHHRHHPHHLHYYSQDRESHSHTKLDENDRSTDDSQAHHHPHQLSSHLPEDARHQDHHLHHYHSLDNETHSHQHTTVTLSRASSSSLSSSPSPSFSSSSWYTETSTNDLFSVCHVKPQHSLSCSNILEVHGGFREDDGSEPVVFATIKHGKPEGLYGQSQHKDQRNFSSLHHGHSWSDEGPLQANEDELEEEPSRGAFPHHRHLYKTASLGRSLAFNEEDILLGASGCPKRAVSSSQLPGKGILKNREPCPDIRKARSMEVLSPRVAKGQGQGGGKGKESPQAQIEKARENFVQGKLQFSAFLDEITKQVISPSHLNILGVNNSKTTGNNLEPAQASGPAKPQLPPKRQSSWDEREQCHNPTSTQEKVAPDKPHLYHRKHSSPDKLTSHTARNHRGSPPSHHNPQTTSQHRHSRGSRNGGRPTKTVGHVVRDSFSEPGPNLTDGTSTSPEPVPLKQRHHHKQQSTAFRSPPPHPQQLPHPQPHQGYSSPWYQEELHKSPTLGSAQVPESEPALSKSDSFRTRDSSNNSQSSEQSVRHRVQAAHWENSTSHRDSLGNSDQFQALREENSDLHQNLVQTVVCIESLETELQRTREELSQVKNKYKSLLETHTETRQPDNLLGEHLHAASESPNSERKHLISCISQLSSELQEAHRTIAALKTINVPNLIKESLGKQFDSAEAVQRFLGTPSSVSPPDTFPPLENQPNVPKVVEAPRSWSQESEAGHQRVTAFMPWNQEAAAAKASDDHPSGYRGASSSPPFSVAHISMAIYKKMAAESVAKSQQHSAAGANHIDAPLPSRREASACDGRAGTGGDNAAESRLGVGDVTYLSAQHILDDFMNQLQPHDAAGEGNGQQLH